MRHVQVYVYVVYVRISVCCHVLCLSTIMHVCVVDCAGVDEFAC